MIKSMTGYGRGEMIFPDRTITVELRSVNNRYLDCSVRLPRLYLFLEDKIKSTVQQEISRGKVDVFITLDSTNSENSGFRISINHAVAKSYCDAFSALSETYKLENPLTSFQLSSMPEVFLLEKEQENTEEVEAQILSVLKQALEDFSAMRLREGQVLQEDILNHSTVIETLLAQIEDKSPVTVEEYRKKIERRMIEMLSHTTIDEGRILTEVAIFADKVAVDEETVRLHSHLKQLKELLAQDLAIGRKLDFLVQEFNREANTIGSKCNDSEISHWVVDLKAEIEKIREQTQNIE